MAAVSQGSCSILVAGSAGLGLEFYSCALKQDSLHVYTLVPANSVETVLQVWGEVQPAVIMIDGLSADFDCFELFKELRNIMGSFFLPIVMIVDHQDKAIAVQALEQGILAYLYRGTVMASSLISTLHQALELVELQRQFELSTPDVWHLSDRPLQECFKKHASVRDANGQIIAFQCKNLETASTTVRHPCELVMAHWDDALFRDYCQVVETGRSFTRDLIARVDPQDPSKCLAFELSCVKLDDGVLTVWRDITQKRRHDHNHDLIELALAHTREAIVVTAADPIDEPGPRVLFVNEAFSQLTGYSKQEIVGHSSRLLQGTKTDPDTKQRIRAALQNREALSAELINYRKDGSEYWLEMSLSPVFDEEGQCTNFIALQRNITRRKQVEAERDHLLLTTHAALEEAKATSRAKDDFISIVSHDLRSPLTSILASVQLLRNSKLQEERRDHILDIIERNSNVQSRLLEDLLDYSRGIQGQMPIEKEWIHLDKEIQTIVQTMQLQAQSKNLSLQLRIELEPLPFKMLLDPTRLQQVMDNLLSNAIKFTPEGGHIDVEVCQTESLLYIAVCDTGQGVTPENLPHLFAPFYQGQAGRSVRQGLGLGLAIVQQIVQRHDGSVNVHSDGLGCGTTFTIQLPVTPPD